MKRIFMEAKLARSEADWDARVADRAEADDCLFAQSLRRAADRSERVATRLETRADARRRALEAPTLTRFRIATDPDYGNFTDEERRIATAAFRRDNGIAV